MSWHLATTLPQRVDSSGDHAALYDPSSVVNTDYGIIKGLDWWRSICWWAGFGFWWILRIMALMHQQKGRQLWMLETWSIKHHKLHWEDIIKVSHFKERKLLGYVAWQWRKFGCSINKFLWFWYCLYFGTVTAILCSLPVHFVNLYYLNLVTFI